MHKKFIKFKKNQKNILITKTFPSGKKLVDELINNGKNAWHLPLIKCYPDKNLFSLIKKINNLSKGDLLFTVSQNAINYAHYWLSLLGSSWPSWLKYYSIGESSGLLMQKLTGFKINFPKNPETSENLLKLSTLNNISGKSALILSGKNSRKILGISLKKRGVYVEYCECYYRYPIKYNREKQSQHLINLKINTLVVTSGEMLQQLHHLIPKNYHKSWLLNCKLITVSKRIAFQAKYLGWNDIVISNSANNYSLLKILLNL